MQEDYYVYYVFDDALDTTRLREIVRFIDQECDVLVPQNGDVDEFVDRLLDVGGNIIPEYERTEFSLRVDDEHPQLRFPTIVLRIGEDSVLPTFDDSDQAAVDRMDEFYTFLGSLYERLVDEGLEPLYVYGLDFPDYDRATDPDHAYYVTSEQILEGEVPGIFWFQIFPPAVVENVGEDRLLSCSAFRLEQLADGAVLLAATQGGLVVDSEDILPKTPTTLVRPPILHW